MVIQLGLGQVSGLGKIVVIEFAEILWIWYRLRQQFVFNHHEVSIVGDLRPESTLRQTDLFFRHAFHHSPFATLSISQA